MQTTKILKRGKLKRYYKSKSFDRYCVTYVDTIVFDKKYYDLLLPEELQAIGAHEFTHLNNGHESKRFIRAYFPPILLAIITLLGFFITNFGKISTIAFFNSLGGILMILFFPWLFIIPILISLVINAKWFRQQEIECDLSAVKFANGEALISALPVSYTHLTLPTILLV